MVGGWSWFTVREHHTTCDTQHTGAHTHAHVGRCVGDVIKFEKVDIGCVSWVCLHMHNLMEKRFVSARAHTNAHVCSDTGTEKDFYEERDDALKPW